MIIRGCKKNKGFTLIEMVVVLGVISIIAVIAVPRYLGVKEKAVKDACTQSENLIIQELYTKYMMDNKSLEEGKTISLSKEDLKNYGIKTTCPDGKGNYTAKVQFKDNDLKISVNCDEHGGTNNQNIVTATTNDEKLTTDIVKKLITKYTQTNKYIDSNTNFGDDNGELLSKYLDINGNVTYWKLSNNDIKVTGNNTSEPNRLCWTTVEVETKPNGTYYIPTYSYSYKNDDYEGIYAVYISEVSVNEGKVTSLKRLDSYEITKEAGKKGDPEYNKKLQFDYVSKFYDEAMKIYNDKYGGSMTKTSQCSELINEVDKLDIK